MSQSLTGVKSFTFLKPPGFRKSPIFRPKNNPASMKSVLKNPPLNFSPTTFFICPYLVSGIIGVYIYVSNFG